MNGKICAAYSKARIIAMSSFQILGEQTDDGDKEAGPKEQADEDDDVCQCEVLYI